MARPGVYELWQQAGRDTARYDRARFLALMREHGHILSPGDDGYSEPGEPRP